MQHFLKSRLATSRRFEDTYVCNISNLKLFGLGFILVSKNNIRHKQKSTNIQTVFVVS